MIIDDQIYDVIIVGTGAGGGTLAYKLAHSGKRILILERGESMSLEEQNRSNVDLFRKDRYRSLEQWYDKQGEPFYPQINYAVGGNTKIYGAALLRFREKDFESLEHQNGISPEWPLKYKDFEPYYSQAEELYQVHGQIGQDPSEPEHSQEYPFGPVEHHPQVASILPALEKQGLHPASIPLGLTDSLEDPTSDSQVNALNPALKYENVTLKTGARVVALHTNSSGTIIKAIQAQINGQSYLFLAEIFVLSCGAIESAALLLNSANEIYPKGIANSSGLVGRNLMKSLMSSVVQLAADSNSGDYARSVYINDFYWGEPDFPYPMGHIYNTGGLLKDIIFAEAPPMLSVVAKLMPNFGLKQLATRSIGWWVQSEDLPDSGNRVKVENNKIYLEYTPNNLQAHDRLVYRWMDILKTVEKNIKGFQPGGIHPHGGVPLEIVANQCGTCRFGSDPKLSVLDLNCRTHDLDNLYVVDGSFFPSSSAISPALTIMANALRVGEHINKRLT